VIFSNRKTKLASKKTQACAELMQLAEFKIHIIRSKRKSISLQVNPERIVLRAPYYSPNIALKAFALSKINWLRKVNTRIQSAKPAIELKYINGEQLLFKGEMITLQIVKNSTSSTQFNQHTKTLTIIVSRRVKNSKRFIKSKIAEWYKQEALNYIRQSAPIFAEKMNVTYRNISARDYKARWGSCSATGNLSFNWRILMAPTSVIDSVIVHELAHIKHFNHSKDFWALVHTTFPDYKHQHNWLKENQYRLSA
jgi:predicted metal-dependent hydrolase